MAREAFLVNPLRSTRWRNRNPLEYLGEGRYRRIPDGESKPKIKRRKEVKKTMARKSTKRSQAAKKAWRKRRSKRVSSRAISKVRVRLGKRARGHVKTVRINSPSHNPGELFLVGNPRRKRRSRRNVPSVNRQRRGYHRNPTLKVGEFDFVKNLPIIAVGGISAVSLVAIPKWLKLEESSKLIQYGAKVGVVAGGGFLLGKTLGSNYAYSWMLAGSAVVLADLLKEYVFPSVLPGIVGMKGFGAFPAIPSMAAFPRETYQLGSPGIGEYEIEDVSPY